MTNIYMKIELDWFEHAEVFGVHLNPILLNWVLIQLLQFLKFGMQRWERFTHCYCERKRSHGEVPTRLGRKHPPAMLRTVLLSRGPEELETRYAAQRGSQFANRDQLQRLFLLRRVSAHIRRRSQSNRLCSALDRVRCRYQQAGLKWQHSHASIGHYWQLCKLIKPQIEKKLPLKYRSNLIGNV